MFTPVKEPQGNSGGEQVRNEGDLTKEAVDDSKQTAHDADEGRQGLIPALQRLLTGCTPEGII